MSWTWYDWTMAAICLAGATLLYGVLVLAVSSAVKVSFKQALFWAAVGLLSPVVYIVVASLLGARL